MQMMMIFGWTAMEDNGRTSTRIPLGSVEYALDNIGTREINMCRAVDG